MAESGESLQVGIETANKVTISKVGFAGATSFLDSAVIQ